MPKSSTAYAYAAASAAGDVICSSWRDLRRRSNAGHGSSNEPEITPPSHSYHRPDGTPGRMSDCLRARPKRKPATKTLCVTSLV